LTALNSFSLLTVQQQGVQVNVSLFAVGNCCSCPTKGAADRRQSLPPATAAGPAQTQTTVTPRGRRPPLLGSGVSVVRWLANLCAHCETRNRAALALSGVAEVLAPVFKSRRKAGAPPDCAGAGRPDTSHDHRESTLGSAPDPGRAGAPWVQSFSQNGLQVYATNPSSRAVHHLAVVPEAAPLGDLGVRLLLRPNDHVQNAVRVLRDRSRQPAGCPRSRNAESHRLMGGSANGRMLRLGSQAATISCS
jgi:hypothetical protein